MCSDLLRPLRELINLSVAGGLNTEEVIRNLRESPPVMFPFYRQKSQSVMIEKTAIDAVNTSITAFELAKKILKRPNATLDKLMDVQDK